MSALKASSDRNSEHPKFKTNMGWPGHEAQWDYTLLPEGIAVEELARLSQPVTVGNTDAVTFQPATSPDDRSQDRFVIEDWHLSNGTWTFRAIFDGHAGHECVDHVASKLPALIKDSLATITEEYTGEYSPQIIQDALSNAFCDLDAAIGQAVLDLFPDPAALENIHDSTLQATINDDGPNIAVLLRCMRGTTALVSIVDPGKANLWVASLGDSAAVFGTKDRLTSQWVAQVLSADHNGENPVEAERVRSEHPGELEAILDNRVLGGIAVTKAFGDYYYKLPKIYTYKVFLNSAQLFKLQAKVETVIGRSITPPYLSAVPDVKHVDLASLNIDDAFLILCSDGLINLSDDRLFLKEKLAPYWVNTVASAQELDSDNLALALLWEGLGGDDMEKVSRHLTVEMESRWVDDTTILIQQLGL
ncbi:hypothetical protein D9619_004313 [Psilocybe cf. subviscida]|uniref:PPM-type phosphatase domain-containing protein n=1 Tax=Psilocybe cf. subviscida TaxID=2480587 RepID=A0A8H5F8B0_9AGAR|nr:hypothetical protein D9619_004313 [Psilocybe cf. subviscida]